MGSTRGGARQAGDLVAVLLAALRVGLLGLASSLALACVDRPPVDPTPSGAGPEGNGATGSAVLRIGTSGDYAPFSDWPADAAEPVGFSIDVARAFAADRGRRIEWVRFRWSELASDAEAGRFDLALSGITIRPDRSALGRFSLPLTTTGATALVGATSPIATRADLERPGLRLAVNRGGHLERVARTLFPSARIEAVEPNAAVPGRLAAGLADAVLTDDLEAPRWQARLPPTRAIGPLTRDRKAAWSPVGQRALVVDLDRWLLAAEASGELARLRARHGLADARTADPLPALLARLDERLALMPAVARAKRDLDLPIEDRAQEARVHVAARSDADRAAHGLGIAPPPDAELRRFVDALLATARFVQHRALEQSATGEAASASERDSGGATAREVAREAGAETSARADAGAGTEDDADTDAARTLLDARLRPAISFLTERILWLAVATRAAAEHTMASPPASGEASRPGAVDRSALARALSAHALPADLEAELAAALDALVSPDPRARTSARGPRARPARRDTAPSA